MRVSPWGILDFFVDALGFVSEILDFRRPRGYGMILLGALVAFCFIWLVLSF